MFSLDQSPAPLDGNFSYLQTSRLPLPALRKSAELAPQEGDKTCGKWEDVAVGSVTAASLAQWMMEAQQKSIAARAGFGYGTEVPKPSVEILDAQIKTGGGGLAGSGSELRWHARVLVPIGQADQQPGQGGGGPLYSLSNKNGGAAPTGGAATNAFLPPRKVSGKAVLRSGVVVFVLVDAPLDRYERNFGGGLTGQEFYDGIADSLQLSLGNF